MRKIGKPKEALAYYQRWLGKAECVYQKEANRANTIELYYAYLKVGETQEELGEWEVATLYYDKALDCLESCLPIKNDPELLCEKRKGLLLYSECYLKHGAPKRAVEYANEAYEWSLAAFMDYKKKSALEEIYQAISLLIKCNNALGNYSECEKYFEKMNHCIQNFQRQRSMEKNIFLYIKMHELKGDCFMARKCMAEAKASYIEALRQFSDKAPFILTDELQKVRIELNKKIAAL